MNKSIGQRIKELEDYNNNNNNNNNALGFVLQEIDKSFNNNPRQTSVAVFLNQSLFKGEFLEDFENWIENIPFSKLFEEDFENWLPSEVFTKIFEENFETDWFINNPFNSLFTENFEGVWE